MGHANHRPFGVITCQLSSKGWTERANYNESVVPAVIWNFIGPRWKQYRVVLISRQHLGIRLLLIALVPNVVRFPRFLADILVYTYEIRSISSRIEIEESCMYFFVSTHKCAHAAFNWDEGLCTRWNTYTHI